MNPNKLIAILALVTASLAAQDAPKQAPPSGGKPKPFSVPARETFTLPNGLRVTLVPYGKVPKTSILAYVRAGNGSETEDQIWLADVVGQYLKEGAGPRSRAQIAEAFADMGGQLGISVGEDQTTVSSDVLSEFAGDAVGIIADILQRPSFPESELNRLVADRVRTLAVALSQPQAIAGDLFAKALYPGHAYGRSFPTEAMLKGYKLDDIRKFYTANFGAQRTHIYIAGVFDPKIRQTVTAAFSKWAKGPATVVNVPKTKAVKTMLTSDRPGATQSTILVGLPVPHPANADYIPMQVADSLLGGAFGSRITTNIREQKGYTYSPSSQVSTRFHDAYWAEQADVTTAVTGAALKEIFFEVDQLRRKAPPAEEVSAITANMNGMFVLRNSSPRGIVGQLRFVDLQGLDDNWLKTYVQKVDAVKPADIQRIAEQYLDPNKMTLVVVGDMSKIKDQIEPYRAAKPE